MDSAGNILDQSTNVTYGDADFNEESKRLDDDSSIINQE